MRRTTLFVSMLVASYAMLFATGIAVAQPANAAPSNEALFRLLGSQSKEAIARLDADPALVDAKDMTGRPLIVAAAARGDLNVVTYLLDKKVDPNVKDKLEVTPLQAAVQGSYDKVAALLIDRGAKLENSKNYTLLQMALNHRSLSMLTTLLDKGADPNVKFIGMDNGNTPLHKAVELDNREFVKVLLAHKADPNVQNEAHVTPLFAASRNKEIEAMLLAAGAKPGVFEAVRMGDMAALKDLIKGDKDLVKRKGLMGFSPIHWAVACENIEAVRFLLDNGADVNARVEQYGTPLQMAVDSDQKEMVALLESKGAVGAAAGDAGAQAQNGARGLTLHSLALEGRVDQMKELIARGADVNAKNDNGQTALQLAAYYGKIESVRLLIDNKAELQTFDKHQNFALRGAAEQGHAEIIKLLCEKGADVNCKTTWGETAIFGAVQNHRDEAVRALIDLGADVNVMGKNDVGTPLYEAVHDFPGNNDSTKAPAIKIAKMLLDAGADMNVKGPRNGRTPLQIAMGEVVLVPMFAKAAKGPKGDGEPLNVSHAFSYAVGLKKLDLAKEILEAGKVDASGYAEALYNAINSKSVDDIDWLLKSGADINLPVYGDKLPIFAALRDLEMFKLLEARGARLDARNKHEDTPLHIAALEGTVEVVRYLIAKGADVTAVNRSKQTPFHIAADRGDVPIAQALLDAKSDINSQDASGRTPLFDATLRKQVPMVEFLVSKGADVNLKSGEGNTPVDYARDEKIRAILEKAGAKPSKPVAANPAGK